MFEACQTFRHRWLAARGAGGEVDEHLAACEPCRGWARVRGAQLAALAALPALEAPATLGEAVAARLADGGRRAIDAVASLERAAAPDELVERVFPPRAPAASGASEAGERVSLGTQAVGALERLSAPTVLDRLVSEELAQPALARAERFPGDLERVPVPPALERRALHGLAPVEPRSLAAPLATLVAAALLVWVAVLGDTTGGAGSEPRYPFRVTTVDTLDGRFALGAGFGEGLLGGLQHAAPLASEPAAAEEAGR